jgi:hypothetical protein
MGINRPGVGVITSQKSNTLLANKQGHYDIVRPCYHVLITELQQLRANWKSQLAHEVNRIMGQYDQLADTLSEA